MNEKERNRLFWKTIWKFTKSYRKNLLFSLIFAIVTGICIGFQPLVIKFIIDEGISNMALADDMRLKTSIMFSIVYLALCIGRMSSWAIGYKNMLVGMEGFLFRIRSEFFEHIQALCMRFYDNNSSGEIFNYIMGTPMANLKNFLSQFALTVPYQLVALFISLSAMLTYDWLLTLVMLIFIMIAIWFNRRARKKIKKLSGDMLKSESEASKYINDMLHGSKAIKMYAIESHVNHDFDKYLGTLKDKGINLTFTQWVENAKPEMIQNICTTVIYIIGALSCVYRSLTVGELVAFVTGMGVIMSSLNQFFSINLVKSNAQAGLERITNILNEQTTTPETRAQHGIEIEKERANRHNLPCVEFKDVSFGYDNTNIFEKLSLKMEYNKSYGLVGSSGSGKSTVTKLIMRLYEINSGEIAVHGCDIKKYNLQELRKSIGIVPQEPFIFRASIIENIRIAHPEAPMQDVIKAMEIARVHEFVNNLERGWNTMVGDGGFDLSGGQKQRIAIARAVLGKPDILIFDEATSALDNISERHIQEAIEDLMKSHTVIIVAHRLTTIKNADKIFVFDKGEIVQEGTFDELSAKDGMFKDMLV